MKGIYRLCSPAPCFDVLNSMTNHGRTQWHSPTVFETKMIYCKTVG